MNEFLASVIEMAILNLQSLFSR